MFSIYSYDPEDLSFLATGTSVDFGSFAAGNHSKTVRVIKPIPSGITLSRINFYLENKGGLENSNFGYFKSNSSILGIEAGSAYLSDNFTEISGVSTIVTGGLSLNASSPENIWLDLETGPSDIKSGNINYRFVYDFT